MIFILNPGRSRLRLRTRPTRQATRARVRQHPAVSRGLSPACREPVMLIEACRVPASVPAPAGTAALPQRIAEYSIHELEPWLSSCRAVEAPSSRCRGRCRGLACRALSSLSSSCRAPSRLTTCGGASSCCRGLSRAVEFLCRGCRVMSSVLSSSRMACSFAILHEAL